MSSFVRFALKFKKEQTPWGDVARDLKQDTEVKHYWNWKRFNQYLEENHSGGSLRVYSILEEMRDAYEALPKRRTEFAGHPFVAEVPAE